MKKKIFLSYGHDEHKNYINHIKIALEKEGLDIWMDSEKIRVKEDWELSIEEALAQSDSILFCITPYSSRRPKGFCLNELAYAQVLNKPIVPIMIDYTHPPLSICRSQYLDLQTFVQQNKYNGDLFNQQMTHLAEVLKNEKDISFEGNYFQNLKLLNPINFQRDINKHIKGFTGREWIYDEVDQWLEDNSSRVLWITADAGYGKSAIAAYLAYQHKAAVGVHFCQYYSGKTKDPVSVIRSFAYQLSTQLPEYLELLKEIDFHKELESMDIHDLFIKILQEPLSKISSDTNLFFIIDALDEADDDNNALTRMIAREFSSLPRWMNVVITGRMENETRMLFSKFSIKELQVDSKENINDLELYITKELKKNHISTNKENISKLTKKSEGNILYLKEVLDDIKKEHLSLDNIDEFPTGMNGIYFNYFTRMFPDIIKYNSLQMLFVSLLSAGYESFSKTLIKHILNITDKELTNLILSFGSFIKIDNNKVSFYHKSMYDWLKNQDSQYMADLEKVNTLIVKRLWKLYKNNIEDKEQYHVYLLHALYKQKEYKKLEKILQDILFIGKIYDLGLHDYYKIVLKNTINNYAKNLKCIDDLKIYESFFREKEHLILKVNEETWKPHQSLFQLAYEDGDNSPLSRYSDKLLNHNKINFVWFKNLWRPKKTKYTGLLKVLNLFGNDIKNTLELKDKRILFLTNNNIIQIWDYEKHDLIVVNQDNTNLIFGVLELQDGKILSYESSGVCKILYSDLSLFKEFKLELNFMNYSNIAGRSDYYKTPKLMQLKDRRIIYYFNDYIIRIYNFNVPSFKVVKVHGGHIYGILELSNGNILSYSSDLTIQVWDSSNGELIRYLKQDNKVVGALELKDGRILFCLSNNIMHIWNLNNNEITQYLQYIDNTNIRTKEIKQISKLNNENILLSEKYSTLGLLNFNSKKVKSFENTVDILELKDGNILSYTDSGTIIIWDSCGIKIKEFLGYHGSIHDVLELKNENILVSGEDGSIRIFDYKKLGILKEYSNFTQGIQQLLNGDILVFREDKIITKLTPRSNESKIILDYEKFTMEKHDLKNGGVLSYLGNGVFQVLNNKEKRLYEINCNFFGTIKIKNEKVLNIDANKTIQVLDKYNHELTSLKHLDDVIGAQELKDGRILSYSKDAMLYLWINNEKFTKDITIYLALERCIFINHPLHNVMYISSGGNLLEYSLQKGNQKIIFENL